MIKIFTSPSCSSCRKVKKWFEDEGIPYIEKNIFAANLKETDIQEILEKSENGTEDIISKKSNIVKEGKVDVDNMTVKQLIEFVKNNPSVLKRPIILDDRRIQVGYNPEEIRTFIPHAKRIALWTCKHECPNYEDCDHRQEENNKA